MTWVLVLAGVAIVVAVAVYALCSAAAAGDADLRRAVEQQARPPAPVGDCVVRLEPDLERLVLLTAQMLDADLAVVDLGDVVWTALAAEQRVRRRAPGTAPVDLVEGTHAVATAPIGDGERGTLSVVSTHPGRRFTGRELALLGILADTCAAALDGAGTRISASRLAEQIDGLAVTLGAERAELRWRGGDFIALTAAVGRRVWLTDGEQAELELAARLLDVGMLRVPTDLIDRPGPLSPTEMRLIRGHALWGAEALRHVGGLDAVAVLVLAHHGRWDGRGYPHGLAGDRIPLGARVLAACDAWWAMTSRRPFAAPLEPEVAAAELSAAAGNQLDPDVVDALFAEVAGVTLVA